MTESNGWVRSVGSVLVATALSGGVSLGVVSDRIPSASEISQSVETGIALIKIRVEGTEKRLDKVENAIGDRETFIRVVTLAEQVSQIFERLRSLEAWQRSRQFPSMAPAGPPVEPAYGR